MANSNDEDRNATKSITNANKIVDNLSVSRTFESKEFVDSLNKSIWLNMPNKIKRKRLPLDQLNECNQIFDHIKKLIATEFNQRVTFERIRKN